MSFTEDRRPKGAPVARGPYTTPTEFGDAVAEVVADPVAFAQRYGVKLPPARYDEDRRVALRYEGVDARKRKVILTPERVFDVKVETDARGQLVELVSHQIVYVRNAGGRCSWRSVSIQKDAASFLYNYVTAILHQRHADLSGTWSGMSWALIGFEVRVEQGDSVRIARDASGGVTLAKVQQLQNEAMHKLEEKKFSDPAKEIVESDAIITIDLVYAETTGARPRKTNDRDERGAEWQEARGSVEAMPERIRDHFLLARPVVEKAFEFFASKEAKKLNKDQFTAREKAEANRLAPREEGRAGA